MCEMLILACIFLFFFIFSKFYIDFSNVFFNFFKAKCFKISPNNFLGPSGGKLIQGLVHPKKEREYKTRVPAETWGLKCNVQI